MLTEKVLGSKRKVSLISKRSLFKACEYIFAVLEYVFATLEYVFTVQN